MMAREAPTTVRAEVAGLRARMHQIDKDIEREGRNEWSEAHAWDKLCKAVDFRMTRIESILDREGA